MFECEHDAYEASKQSDGICNFKAFIYTKRHWVTGSYRKGKKVGKFTTFDLNNIIQSVHEYNNDHLINKAMTFYPSGKLKSEIEFKGGQALLDSLKLFTTKGNEV